MQIPGYKIIDTLGEGGMARVYLAIQESFEREVALKVLDPHLSRDPTFGERFLHEARIVSRLVHPNIVTVYDVGVHRGNHFLSMEYVPGRDLKHRRFELSLYECIGAIKDVARALDYAGRKGCVHRDVKPDNIMLHAEDGRAVLMDFGIARIVDQTSAMTQTGTTVGTPHYMSPEHARGAPVDSRSDLYSLGVVLFLLLTGHLPYDSDSAVAIGVMHISDSIPRLPEHLAPFQPLIDRILAKAPEDRFQTGDELVEALEAFDRDTLDALERAGERSLLHEADGESPTLVQPQAVMAESLSGGDVGADTDLGVSGDYLAVHDEDRIDRENNTGEPRLGVLGWVLLFGLLVGIGVYVGQEPLRAEWERRVAPLLPEGEAPGPVAEEAESVSGLEGDSDVGRTMAQTDERSSPELDISQGQQEVAPNNSAVALAGEMTPERPAPEAPEEREVFEEEAAFGADSGEPPSDPVGVNPPQSDEPVAQPSRDERIAAVSDAAEALAGQGDLAAALLEIDRAMTEFPDSEKLALQRERLEAQQSRLQEVEAERRARTARDARLQEWISAIETRLANDDLEGAGEQLRDARNEFANSSALLALEVEWSERRDLAQQPTIEQAQVSSEPMDSLQGEQQETLAPARVLYAGFAYRNFGETSSVIQAILYDGSRQLQIALVPVIVQGEEGARFFRLERPVTGFVEGGYHLDLVSDGEALSSVSFQIGG